MHRFWEKHVQLDDIVIDATCGNGKDTLLLANLSAKVLAFDIQERALQTAKALVSSDKVVWIHQSHACFPEWIAPHSVGLINYNLGYLPGGDKTVTTQGDTTIRSVQNGLKLLRPGGAVTLICYPGHDEGQREEQQLLAFVSTLKDFDTSYTCWPNKHRHPSVIIMKQEAGYLRRAPR